MKIYVGSLDYDTSEEEIKTAFEKMGKVISVTLAKDKNTGMSKGYGFVEMSTKQEALKAIEKMNNEFVGARMIKVSVVKKRY